MVERYSPPTKPVDVDEFCSGLQAMVNGQIEDVVVVLDRTHPFDELSQGQVLVRHNGELWLIVEVEDEYKPTEATEFSGRLPFTEDYVLKMLEEGRGIPHMSVGYRTFINVDKRKIYELPYIASEPSILGVSYAAHEIAESDEPCDAAPECSKVRWYNDYVLTVLSDFLKDHFARCKTQLLEPEWFDTEAGQLVKRVRLDWQSALKYSRSRSNQ